MVCDEGMAITDKADVVGIVRDAVKSAIGQGELAVGVACSGGVDSMALADAAIAVAGRVVIVTIDHQMQAASAEVARGVADWAKGQGVDAIVRRVHVAGTSEGAAREARYAAFAEIAAERGLGAILIAHTQRDQAETVLMRIIRGTGPLGIAGMAGRRMGYLRPLLAITRAQTEAYVAARGLPHWDDPMNRDTAYTRVRIREQVLPELRDLNPNIDEALVRLADSAREWQEAIDAIALPWAKLPIDCPQLANQPVAIRKRAIAIALGRVSLDAAHLEAIDALVCAPSRGEVGLDIPAGRVIRRYDLLTLDDVSRPEVPRICELVAPAGYKLRLSRPGDRFRPVRLNGHSKKLSDLYIDLKLPRDQRARARVMVRVADGAITWAEHLGTAHGEATDLTPLPGRTDGRI